MVSGVELRDYLDFAGQTAYEAGHLTLGYFQTDTLRPELKPDDTPVTAADREAEEFIRARIGAKLREAGGYFGDWSGNETIYAGEALSTTGELLPEVLRLIKDQ